LFYLLCNNIKKMSKKEFVFNPTILIEYVEQISASITSPCKTI